MTKISMVIPVYNEEKLLRAVFEKVRGIGLPCPVEYILIDDCSKDKSWEIIQDLKKQYPEIKIHHQEVNKGKGAALHCGFGMATGDIIIVQDADFEYDPNDLPGLVQPLLNDTADVVYGSRYHRSRHQVHRTFHLLINRFLTFTSNLLSGIYLSDMETCYKVFKADILKNINLECQRFGFEPEVTAKIAKLNLRIEEHPIRYYPRNYHQGKKINWRDGVAALWFIFKFNVLAGKNSYLAALPEKYRASGRQWL